MASPGHGQKRGLGGEEQGQSTALKWNPGNQDALVSTGHGLPLGWLKCLSEKDL